MFNVRLYLGLLLLPFFGLIFKGFKEINNLLFLASSDKHKFIAVERVCPDPKYHSPWYNRNGWLGVKHQVTYLPKYHTFISWSERDRSL